MNAKYLVIGISLVIVAITSPPAAAQHNDAKTFPGSLCFTGSNTPSDLLLSPNTNKPFFIDDIFEPFHSGAGKFNSSGLRVNINTGLVTAFDASKSFTQNWSCPIVRDVTVGKTNGILNAFVEVVDSHITENVLCTLTSGASGGALPVEKQTTSSTGTGRQRLEFANLDSATDGFYFFLCRVPGGSPPNGAESGIVYYKVTEHN